MNKNQYPVLVLLIFKFQVCIHLQFWQHCFTKNISCLVIAEKMKTTLKYFPLSLNFLLSEKNPIFVASTFNLAISALESLDSMDLTGYPCSLFSFSQLKLCFGYVILQSCKNVFLSLTFPFIVFLFIRYASLQPYFLPLNCFQVIVFTDVGCFGVTQPESWLENNGNLGRKTRTRVMARRNLNLKNLELINKNTKITLGRKLHKWFISNNYFLDKLFRSAWKRTISIIFLSNLHKHWYVL